MKQQATVSSIIQGVNNVFGIIHTEVGLKDTETERELFVNGSQNSRGSEPGCQPLIDKCIRCVCISGIRVSNISCH